MLNLLHPSDYPNYLKCKLKAYTIQNLPKSISRAFYGSFVGQFQWRHRSKEGIILASDVNFNTLTDMGEQDISECFFCNQNVPPGDIYLGLSNSTPTESSTLSSITEVSGNNYLRQSISRSILGWPVRSLQAGDWQIESALKTFTATGNWTQATHVFLCSVQIGTVGRLWSYLALTTPRVLGGGDSLDYTYKIKLQ